jgi:murein DD-endopeptidase MepM/ murein hydrolase activator NlpD
MLPYVAIGVLGVVLYMYNNTGTSSLLTDTGGFQNPVPGACVTSPYGERSAGMHYGVDYGVGAGTAVLCAHSGVVYAAFDAGPGTGLFIGVGWDGGTGQRGPHIEYMHLSELLVKTGESVTRGQVIARSGATGGDFGDHLHVEYKDPAGNYVNPPWEVENPSRRCT